MIAELADMEIFVAKRFNVIQHRETRRRQRSNVQHRQYTGPNKEYAIVNVCGCSLLSAVRASCLKVARATAHSAGVAKFRRLG